jgi:hypothetical protein
MGRVGAHLSTKNRLALLTNATVAYKEFNFLYFNDSRRYYIGINKMHKQINYQMMFK